MASILRLAGYNANAILIELQNAYNTQKKTADFFYMQNSSIHLLREQGVGTSQHLITDPKKSNLIIII